MEETVTWFPVMNAISAEQEIPVILAIHEVFTTNLQSLIAVLGSAFDSEVWDLDPNVMNEIGEAYIKFIQSPDEIGRLEQNGQSTSGS